MATPETSDKTSEDGVVELLDEDDEAKSSSNNPVMDAAAPFLSQGEIDEDALNPDFSDAKQTRVIIYTILSLLPVLFLIPLMLSREFLPAIMQMDELPPVNM